MTKSALQKLKYLQTVHKTEHDLTEPNGISTALPVPECVATPFKGHVIVNWVRNHGTSITVIRRETIRENIITILEVDKQE